MAWPGHVVQLFSGDMRAMRMGLELEARGMIWPAGSPGEQAQMAMIGSGRLRRGPDVGLCIRSGRYVLPP